MKVYIVGLGLNLLGDGLREPLDPSLRGTVGAS
jgi:ABC-type dipeptide/oligopeptide/nickel transport system permease subunit